MFVNNLMMKKIVKKIDNRLGWGNYWKYLIKIINYKVYEYIYFGEVKSGISEKACVKGIFKDYFKYFSKYIMFECGNVS